MLRITTNTVEEGLIVIIETRGNRRVRDYLEVRREEWKHGLIEELLRS
jgi:hypothetical protein